MKVSNLLFFIFLPLISIGQDGTYLGGEIGPKFEIYKFEDNGSGLYAKPFYYEPIYGIIIGHNISKVLFIESGFYFNDYGQSYRIKGDLGYTASNALLAYQIPICIKARLNLIKERISVTTTIGYTFAINREYGSSGSGGSFSRTTGLQYNDSTRTQYTSTYSLRKTYGMLETGIGLEYKFKNSLIIYLASYYFMGLSRIVKIDVKYWINDQPEQTGSVFSNGDFYSIVFGMKYPISKFWNNKRKKTGCNFGFTQWR